MVQPLFFCAWNHSTEPEQGDLLAVFAHTGQREAKRRLIDGGDLAEWFAEWLPKVRSVIATIPAQSEAAD
jgi:hypothetical protein